MAARNQWRLAQVLGFIVLLLAWSAAAIEYYLERQIRWSLLAAGVLFAVLPWAGNSTQAK